MPRIISLKLMYVYKYCEYNVKLLLNGYFFDSITENSTIPIPFSPLKE